ncbi:MULTISPECIES: hypothetical protein [Bacillus]|uniref:hypothetical protein n=1 Tax=Bacillus TaxID=1386 RepID=UPI00047C2E73|nr:MULTISPECIES: hypothetical protein [Bacillus]QHZ45303.1 hypothetical protein M654_002780 [Bacillus sp. NSP9.1]WFA04900.1 hypothetical protein P3X63_20375 [Bacillus sp. HSf4]
MFGFRDIITFFWSFLLVFPAVSVLHALGHSFMVLIFGGKPDLEVGMGKKLIKIGVIQIRSIYFMDSFCNYSDLKYDNRYTHALIYAGGAIFNLASIFIVNSLIIHDILAESIFLYQFVYFSTYYLVFALIPVRYSENHLSDGMAIYQVLKYGEKYETNH